MNMPEVRPLQCQPSQGLGKLLNDPQSLHPPLCLVSSMQTQLREIHFIYILQHRHRPTQQQFNYI